MSPEQIKEKTKETYEHLMKTAKFTGHAVVEAACIQGACNIVQAQIIAQELDQIKDQLALGI